MMQPFIYPLHAKKVTPLLAESLIDMTQHAEVTATELLQIDSPYSIIYMHCSPSDDDTFLKLLLISPGAHHSYELKKGDDTISYFLNRPLHQHNFFEILYVIKGVVKQHIEKNCFPYTSGQCCFINRNTRHIEEYTTDFEAVFFGMSEDFLMHMIQGDILYKKDVGMQKYNCDIYEFICENQTTKSFSEKKYIDYVPANEEAATTLRDLMDQIILESLGQKPGCSFITLGLCARFISTLEDAAQFHKNVFRLNASAEDFLFIRIQLILEKNNGRIRREDLSLELHYSGDYLNRVVKSHTGMSLIEYGLTFCLKKAKWLLLHTELTVGEIITYLGFSNRSYFYRIFEKEYGISPKAMQRGRKTSPAQ